MPEYPSPIDADALGGAVGAALSRLAPSGFRRADPLQALANVQDGLATITIPLQAGSYRQGIVSFDVKPGTVAKVQVVVVNGRVMPAIDAQGRPTARGTQVRITPPIDLPLWVRGDGVALRGRKDASAELLAELGGFFDLRVREIESTQLVDVVRGLNASRGSERQDLVRRMLQPERAHFAVKATLNGNLLKLGSATLNLASGSEVRFSGTPDAVDVDAEVKLDGASLVEGDTQVQLGKSSGRLQVKWADSQLRLRLSSMSAQVNGATLQAGRDRLELGPSQISGGVVELRASFRAVGNDVPQVIEGSVSLKGHVDGALRKAQLTIADAEGQARLSASSRRIEGHVDVSAAGAEVDLSLTGATLDVNDLQTRKGSATLGVREGRVAGDGRLVANTRAGTFALGLNASGLDLHVDGYEGRATGGALQLGDLMVTGAGTLSLSSAEGTAVDGQLQFRSEVKTLEVGRSLALGAGTVIEGEVSRLRSSGTAGVELTGRASIDANITHLNARQGQLMLNGSGRLHGDVVLDLKPGASVVEVRGQAEIVLDDGRLGDAAGPLNLDLGKGSAKVAIDAGFTRGPTPSSHVDIGPGSSVDATLEAGHLTVSGQRVDIEPGTAARVNLERLESTNGVPVALMGSLSVDGGVRTDDISGLNVGGVEIAEADSLKGHATLEVPHFRLTPSGTLEYADARLSVAATVGDGPAPSAARIVGERPAGVLSEAEVKAKTAAAIAGSAVDHNATSYDLTKVLKVIRQMKTGTLELNFPLEGRVGTSWLESADFAPGTNVKLTLAVENGLLVPSKTRVAFSKPGDAVGWVEVEGAYLDDTGRIRADLELWRPLERIQQWLQSPLLRSTLGLLAVPAEALPDYDPSLVELDGLSVGALVDWAEAAIAKEAAARGDAPSGFGAGLANGQLEVLGGAINVGQTWLHADGVSFEPGQMEVPGGWLDVGPETRLSVRGRLDDAEVEGTVQLRGLDISQGGVALKGSDGTAKLKVSWRNGLAVTTLERLNVRTEYAVSKRVNGDYIEFGRGRLTDGTLKLAVPVDARDFVVLPPTWATLDVPEFTGRLDGARLTKLVSGTRPTQIEVGPTQLSGEVHLGDEHFEVKGSLGAADVLVKGLQASSSAGAVELESARLLASGRVDFSSTRGVTLDVNLAAADIHASRASTMVAGATASASRTHVTGAGHLAWSSSKGLALEGAVNLESVFSGTVTPPKVE